MRKRQLRAQLDTANMAMNELTRALHEQRKDSARIYREANAASQAKIERVTNELQEAQNEWQAQRNALEDMIQELRQDRDNKAVQLSGTQGHLRKAEAEAAGYKLQVGELEAKVEGLAEDLTRELSRIAWTTDDGETWALGFIDLEMTISTRGTIRLHDTNTGDEPEEILQTTDWSVAQLVVEDRQRRWRQGFEL